MRKRFIRTVLSFVASAALLAPVLGACGGGGDDDKKPVDDTGFDPGDGGGIGTSTCATDSKKAEVKPVDLLIGLDTSFSMDFDKKWLSVQSALKTFVQNQGLEGLGVGLQYFPLRKQCSVADYAVPQVPITELPAAAQPVASSLDGQQMFGGTPLVPVLQGLRQYLTTWAVDHPERKPVIVLATDGIPDDTCQGASDGATANTIDNAVAAARESFEGTPSINVFMIGVGSELTALNAIGQAGGTGNAILVDTTKDVEQAFLEALQSIQKTAIPCDYDIPQLGGPPNPNKINVNYVTADGQTLFLYVGSEIECITTEHGWYFDDPATPSKVVLCPKACEKVKSSDQGRLDVVFGCERVSIR